MFDYHCLGSIIELYGQNLPKKFKNWVVDEQEMIVDVVNEQISDAPALPGVDCEVEWVAASSNVTTENDTVTIACCFCFNYLAPMAVIDQAIDDGLGGVIIYLSFSIASLELISRE